MLKKNKIRVIISWSSGKDSTLTLLRLLENDDYEVVGLFTTYVDDIVPFQATPLNVVKAQAESIGLPITLIELPEVFPENSVYQQRVVEGLKSANIEFEGVAFGDILCNGIAEYRRTYIQPAGWHCLFPLLGESPNKLAQEIIERNIQTFICTVDTTQLDGCFVGKEYNQSLLDSLPEGVDLCGENGEFHTLVYNAACFDKSLNIEFQEIQRQTRFHYHQYQLKF